MTFQSGDRVIHEDGLWAGRIVGGPDESDLYRYDDAVERLSVDSQWYRADFQVGDVGAAVITKIGQDRREVGT